MDQAREIQAAAAAIRGQRPEITDAELREQLRAEYLHRSVWHRIDRSAAESTSWANDPASYLLALLIVAPAASLWDCAFGPRPEVIERWIDAAIGDSSHSTPSNETSPNA